MRPGPDSRVPSGKEEGGTLSSNQAIKVAEAPGAAGMAAGTDDSIASSSIVKDLHTHLHTTLKRTQIVITRSELKCSGVCGRGRGRRSRCRSTISGMPPPRLVGSPPSHSHVVLLPDQHI